MPILAYLKQQKKTTKILTIERLKKAAFEKGGFDILYFSILVECNQCHP
jgi:hypothetical protein